MLGDGYLQIGSKTKMVLLEVIDDIEWRWMRTQKSI